MFFMRILAEFRYRFPGNPMWTIRGMARTVTQV